MKKLIVLLAILIPYFAIAANEKSNKKESVSQKETIKEDSPDLFERIGSYLFDDDNEVKEIELIKTDDEDSAIQENKGFFARMWDTIVDFINAIFTVVVVIVVLIISVKIIMS